ncbi:MAG: glycerol-3-phosphate acyltransferase, partial [Culicoidibacterales bacterium]
VGDLLKGFVPIFCYTYIWAYPLDSWVAVMLIMPILGHVLPIFARFHGGKGVAVTFGVILGLLPVWQPIAILVSAFVCVRFLVHIQPDYALTISAYLLASLGFWLLLPTVYAIGFSGIVIIVVLRLVTSCEPRAKVEVAVPWKH